MSVTANVGTHRLVGGQLWMLLAHTYGALCVCVCVCARTPGTVLSAKIILRWFSGLVTIIVPMVQGNRGSNMLNDLISQ